ncbi:hypothetical protein MJO29_002124, partial [Puccinia striiformis f. sp. tritici]
IWSAALRADIVSSSALILSAGLCADIVSCSQSRYCQLLSEEILSAAQSRVRYAQCRGRPLDLQSGILRSLCGRAAGIYKPMSHLQCDIVICSPSRYCQHLKAEEDIMADFPGNTPSYIGPLFTSSSGASEPSWKPQGLQTPTVVSWKACEEYMYQSTLLGTQLLAQVASAKDLALLPAEAVQPNNMGPLPEEVPIITGVQDDNDGREAMVRDGTPADAPPANNINLAAHETARIALERQRPPSPFLPGQDPGSIRARNASSETTHEGGQANQIKSPAKGQVGLKRQSREGDSDTDSSVDWGHFDNSADKDFIPHRHQSNKERQSIKGPQSEEDDHSFKDCHSIEERESDDQRQLSDNLSQSKEERLLIKVRESDEDRESIKEGESNNQRQSKEEPVLIEVSESDEDWESNEEGKSDREHESNEEHLQGNHGNSRFEEERQSTGVDHASRSRLPSAGESCMTVCGTTFGRAPAPPILGPTREVRASAARATQCLDNTRYIIANLRGVLGYKQPVAVPSGSSMMKSAAKCFQQCKAENVLLGEDGDCFIGEQFVNRACLGSRKATGNARANNRGDAIDVLPNPDHPLFVMINSTSDPIRGSWTRLKNTICDICGLMHGHRAVTLLDNLRGVNGSSDQALLAVHGYFEGITGGDDDDSAEPPVAAPGGSGKVGEGGIRYVFEFIASAISPLVSLHMDQRTQDRQLVAQEDQAAQIQRSHTKSIACLSQLLILGPAAIFTSPRRQKYITEWQFCMLLEYGSLVVQEQYRNAATFPSPPWTHFGNTRPYIFSHKKLAEVLWEDIVFMLMTDYTEQKPAEVVWAHSDPAVDRGN